MRPAPPLDFRFWMRQQLNIGTLDGSHGHRGVNDEPVGVIAEPAELLYLQTVFGVVTQIHCHQGTWFGMLDITVDDNATLALRLREFASFCEGWNARQHDPEPPGSSEFQRFPEMSVPGAWLLRSRDGAVIHQIDNAPNFIGDREISW